MRLPTCALSLALAAALLVTLLAPVAGGQSDGEDLLEIRAEIERLQNRLDEVRQERSGLEGQLEQVDVELALQRQRMAEAAAAKRSATEAVDEIQGRVDVLERGLSEARTALRERLAGLYRLGRQGYLRLVLSAEPEGDLLAAMRVARFLARRDRQAVGEYERARDSLAEEKSALVVQQREAEAWTQREALRRSELAGLRRKHQGLLVQLERERRRIAAEAIDLADRERRLSTLFSDLWGGGSILAGSPIQQFRGALEWPLAGEVMVGFGTRLDPRYQTRVPHNGVEIAPADAGGPVRAVYPGRVLYAAPFQGYGPTVVVHHAGRAFTLYAGLRELRVTRDDVVALGSELGLVADRLYFEIRVENKPQDPTDWLR